MVVSIVFKALFRIIELGRLEDFLSVLINIGNGTLLDNIALHLLLDVGCFYRNNFITRIRYTEESLSFWALIQIAFGGRGIKD